MGLDRVSGGRVKTGRHAWRTVWLTAGLVLALGLVGAAAYADSITCIPSTTPCQTCPAPTCPAPTNTCPPPFNTTSSNSTLTCAGSFAQTTQTTTTVFGPANICIGANQSQGFFVCPGTLNVNTNTDTIVAGVAIPTLSVWALCALAVGLGALALRRLRGLRPAQG